MYKALFIDANQYLRLYGMANASGLLEALEEQKEYIFVSTQIADEVMRNKLDYAKLALAAKFKKLDEKGVVPDHLLGVSR
jgi:hypothetical protein